FAYGTYAGGAPNTSGGGPEPDSNGYNPRTHFQAAQSAGFHTGGEDAQPRTLYVGNLDPSVTEEFISTLFGQIGVISKSKVIFDGNSDPYAFVEFQEHAMAAQALQAMNKRMLLDKEMKVNWATEPGTVQKVDTSRHFHVFVGDLSPEIDNKMLKEAFNSFGDISEAKVIRDPTTLKSKGYGFVSFPKRDEAERAIEQMNGQWLGRRAIRTNWATRKPTDANESGNGSRREMNYDDVYNQTTNDNTSVYIGNVAQGATEDDIRQAFGGFGQIQEIRCFKAQGYSFVKFERKESAARAIIAMTGQELCGQSVKCSWGKTDITKQAGGGGGYNNGGGYGNNGGGGYGGGNPQQQSQWYGRNNYGNGAYGSGGAAAAHQQYMQYYQQYYQQNPQLMQQWQQYYSQQYQNPGDQQKQQQQQPQQ
ncbi:hypothetical protein PENTCL1PPCAC_8285, partial [Pristionchus entomophagus]